jgi:hypothetical protein
MDHLTGVDNRRMPWYAWIEWLVTPEMLLMLRRGRRSGLTRVSVPLARWRRELGVMTGMRGVLLM